MNVRRGLKRIWIPATATAELFLTSLAFHASGPGAHDVGNVFLGWAVLSVLLLAASYGLWACVDWVLEGFSGAPDGDAVFRDPGGIR